MMMSQQNSAVKIQPLEFEKPLISLEKQIAELVESEKAQHSSAGVSERLESLQTQAQALRHELYDCLSPARKLQVARHPQRLNTLEVIAGLSPDCWVELHGDRAGADDRAIVGGIIELDDMPVMVVGTQKGRGMKENLVHNFGMANPEGYRKAKRLFAHADKFKMPVVTFIDTPGAYPGIEGEQKAIGHAIAENIKAMALMGVPILSVVMGEASSGGALGIGVSNLIYMLEHAQYTVISPEGCASILWRSASFATQAAEALKITADDLVRFGICDGVIAEPQGGAHYNPAFTIDGIKTQLLEGLTALKGLSREALKQQRYDKYRAIGAFEDRLTSCQQ
jgi:acetyl-CoA carboxylase carboxyl transferase subunit alpha